MSLTRIHNFSISLDGFGSGEPQSAEAPFGHAGERLHEWMFATRFWGPGGTAGVDDAFAERHGHGIGAEIMGANKFGPPGWTWYSAAVAPPLGSTKSVAGCGLEIVPLK